MFNHRVRVLVTPVSRYTLVECEKCGPVGVWMNATINEAATAHLSVVHGSATTLIKETP